MSDKVLVGMSGGVDSSVAAKILIDSGYTVGGITLNLCDSTADCSDDAKAVCDKMGIEHYSLDLSEAFKKYVISDFINEYKLGNTPNPCIICNKYIKFGERVMVKCADEIIVLSESARAYFRETYQRETVLIHNGIQRPVKKDAQKITLKYGLEKDDYICIVSRLTAEKGVHYLIDAFNAIKTDKKLVIAGDTSDTDEYVSMLKAKAADNPNILFTGFISGKSIMSSAPALFTSDPLFCFDDLAKVRSVTFTCIGVQ